MDWFRHDYFASTDLKIRKLLRNYGECAYGAYWIIVELLYQQGGSATAEEIDDAFGFMTSPNLKDILADSGLFQVAEDGSWSSNRVYEELHIHEESRKARSEAGKKGMASRWGIKDNDVITNDNKVITTDNNPITRNNTQPNTTKNTDIKESSSNELPKKGVFVKPSLSEIQTYCKERKNNVDPEEFYDFYESKGWFVGKNKMKDWKACIRTWEKSKSDKAPTPRKDYSDIGVQNITKIDWGV